MRMSLSKKIDFLYIALHFSDYLIFTDHLCFFDELYEESRCNGRENDSD